MNKSLILVWVILVLLTITTGVISTFPIRNAVVAILVLSILKFMGVSFYFMQLKKAHIFWKASVLIYALLFLTIVLIFI